MRFRGLTISARQSGRLHTVALLLAALAGMLAYPLAARSAPSPGDYAPDFVLKDLAGRNLRLSEYQGELVVIAFWASWCSGCRQALTDLAQLPTRDERLQKLGVSLDADPGRAASIVASLDLGFPTLVDESQKVGRLYEISRLPLTLLLDQEGRVRGIWGPPPSREEFVRRIEELGRE